MRKEWKQFWAQPQYWTLFVAAELIFVLVTLRLLEGWQDIPGMIFFIMAFNLLFLLYGAEQARLETRYHTPELVSSLPYAARYYGSKLLFWVSHAALWYAIFLGSLLVFLKFQLHNELSIAIVKIVISYTFYNWFVPFLVSMILGYALFTLWPSLVTYAVLVAVWILLSPYNHYVQLLPSQLFPWLAVSDVNFSITQHIYVTEHMIVNDGARWQRGLVVITAVAVYMLVIPVIRKLKVMRVLIPLLIIGIVLIALLAPNQQISDISRGTALESNPYQSNDYEIEAYKMEIRHPRHDHAFSYTAEVSISTKSNEISFALWGTIHIDSLSWNGKQIPYTRSGNWVSLSLPKGSPGEGTLHLETSSEAYSDVNPTSFELLPTLPWYPMHPDEALDPMGHAKKERYEIKLNAKGFGGLVTNLTKGPGGTLSGETYGPMLLKARYERKGSIVRLVQYSQRTADQKWQSISKIVDKLNKQMKADVKLPQQMYVVSSWSLFSANPDAIFVTPLQISLEEKIRQTLFRQL